MGIRFFDDATGHPIADDKGVEVVLIVAGASEAFHYDSFDSVPWITLIAAAEKRGELVAVAARNMASTTVGGGGGRHGHGHVGNLGGHHASPGMGRRP